MVATVVVVLVVDAVVGSAVPAEHPPTSIRARTRAERMAETVGMSETNHEHRYTPAVHDVGSATHSIER